MPRRPPKKPSRGALGGCARVGAEKGARALGGALRGRTGQAGAMGARGRGRGAITGYRGQGAGQCPPRRLPPRVVGCVGCPPRRGQGQGGAGGGRTGGGDCSSAHLRSSLYTMRLQSARVYNLLAPHFINSFSCASTNSFISAFFSFIFFSHITSVPAQVRLQSRLTRLTV
jgi:hypothetical protein